MRTCTIALLMCLVAAGCGEAEPGREAVVADWVQSLNARDFARACELSVVPEGFPCEDLLSEAFEGYEGDVSVQGTYADGSDGEQEPLAFSLSEGPDGLTAGEVEEVDGEFRVHWEAQIIR